MSGPRNNFDKRLNAIGLKHAAMARGYTTEIRSDGLIVVKPYVRRRGFSIPVAGVVMLLAGLLFFKAFILAAVGPDLYDERVAKLGEGTFVEQGGAWVMQVEPATEYFATVIGPIFR
tara:strand:- start:95 stop:445 length:351 start_codon:yes stop_codon:yes gene_type:complete